MKPPTKRETTSKGDEADRILDKFTKCSRDHMLTLTNDELCMSIARSWIHIDAALNQTLRDMAKPTGDKESFENMNAIMCAGSQIISRMHEFAERGSELLSQPTK